MPVICTHCGLAIPSKKRKDLPMCQDCKYYKNAEKKRKWHRRKSESINGDWELYHGRVWENARFNEWLILIQHVDKNYPRLTEAQWVETLKHFDYKCAMCQENVAIARHYFVSQKDGGMYCDWNIIPVCKHCIDQTQSNPFKAMNLDTQRNMNTYAHKHHYGKKKLNKILEYLTPKLLEAVKKSNSQQNNNTCI